MLAVFYFFFGGGSYMLMHARMFNDCIAQRGTHQQTCYLTAIAAWLNNIKMSLGLNCVEVLHPLIHASSYITITDICMYQYI